MRARRLSILAVAAVSLLTGFFAAAAPAQARPSPVIPRGWDESVAYLVGAYHVTAAEAVRRLELQRIAPGLADRLERGYPDAYGGVWLGPPHGGVPGGAAPRPPRLAAAAGPGARRGPPPRGPGGAPKGGGRRAGRPPPPP